MILPTLDDIRYQARFVVHIEARDVGKRLVMAVLMAGVCIWAGSVQAAAVMLFFVAQTEISARVIHARLPASDRDMGHGFLMLQWFNNWFSTMVYLIPSVALAGHGSVAFLLAGFLWLFGAFVHISNTFVFLPFFNWTISIPAFGVAFYVFHLASRTDYGPSGAVDWLIASGLMLVYIFNTIQTIGTQKDTHRALRQARAEADARLHQLEHLASHDGLTGLLNRSAFDRALARMLDNPHRRTRIAVFLIDLDGFKPINDTYSHAAGDHVLSAMAGRLRDLAGEGGIVARLGGDEFIMAVPGMSSPRVAQRLGQHTARSLAVPITFEDKVLRVGASVGISMPMSESDTPAVLCAHADRAMFQAKATRDGGAVLFDETSTAQRASLEDRKQIVIAMRSGQIRPFYQPKVTLSDGRLCGFEALARWERPDGTIAMAGEFLPLVDELGLHGDFLQHMARLVLVDLDTLMADGLDPGQVSINIPEIALATQSGFSDLEGLLHSYSHTWQHLTFEITEDVFIARSGEIIQQNVSRLRQVGVRISLDDFGTGFASFQHLRQLEFDELKIETRFVSSISSDPKSRVLVAGFLSIAQGLDVDVVAEGIETQAQIDVLVELGCRVGQGYLFGRAMPFDEIRVRLLAERPEGTGNAVRQDRAAVSPLPVAPTGSDGP